MLLNNIRNKMKHGVVTHWTVARVPDPAVTLTGHVPRLQCLVTFDHDVFIRPLGPSIVWDTEIWTPNRWDKYTHYIIVLIY